MNPVSIRPATAHDRDDLFAWRNDPTTQRNSKNAGPVAWDTHVAWFADALMSPNRKIYIGYRGTAKIGAVRFDKIDGADNVFLVSITISPAQRGRGFGKGLLCAGIETLPSAILTAEIASDNFVSRRIFEACGFQHLIADTSDGLLQYRRDPLANDLGA
jgi:RimJ/RimL family protein N-acetyltransferase